MKSWLAWLTVLAAVGALYVLEFSKVSPAAQAPSVTLDNLPASEAAAAWEPFYQVRAKLIDGQHASFSIPEALRQQAGKRLKLVGAPVFSAPGVSRLGDTVTVRQFVLLPTLGLAEACNLQPDEAMRWTVRAELLHPWKLHRDEMIRAETAVEGRFRINTAHPYDGIFFLDDARATLIDTGGKLP